jgi:hypothetical protein
VDRKRLEQTDKLLDEALEREPADRAALSLFSIETREKRGLTFPRIGSAEDGAPAVSPDGRGLAFCRWSMWADGGLHFLDLTSDLRPIKESRRITFGNL